jgi:GntR family transcriptional regulator / MocR family aminotransferase
MLAGEGGLPSARLASVAPAVRLPGDSPALDPRRILDWACAQDGWILEDDRDSELLQADEAQLPFAAMNAERVLFVGSFNRVLFPGLCVAFLVAPMALAERLRGAHAIAGGRASLASQLALKEFIAEGHLARHLRRRRAAYAERRAALLEQLAGVIDIARSSMAGLHLAIEIASGKARALEARLTADHLGSHALSDVHLLLGLGASLETIRAEGPRLAVAIRSETSCLTEQS